MNARNHAPSRPTQFDYRALCDWYAANARPLLWRRPGTTAWGVLVSEVMSQQTPVARVQPIWQQWMDRWPTPQDFAAASRADILRAWGSLGYPRRALRLHECAQEITARYGAESNAREGSEPVPEDLAELLALPGIGDYTARAVLCFHYDHNVAVVDTNVRRVYARAVSGNYLQSPARASDLRKQQALVDAAPDDVHGPTFSVAMMELGALVCTASSPDCGHCPIQASCAWQLAGAPAPSEQELAQAKKRVQKFAGTDRQVRGIIMKALRESDSPVTKGTIDLLWPDAAQRDRALLGLLEDGLVEQLDSGFALPA